MKPTYDQLEKALLVATTMLEVYEPKDSRAVSDEFVAITAIQCGFVDDKVMSVIDKFLYPILTIE